MVLALLVQVRQLPHKVQEQPQLEDLALTRAVEVETQATMVILEMSEVTTLEMAVGNQLKMEIQVVETAGRA